MPPRIKLFPRPQARFRDRLLACKSVTRAVELLSERFFIISVGTSTKVVVCEERHDRGEPLRMYKFEEFKKRFLPYRFQYKNKQIDLGTLYVQSEHRRQYDGHLVFRPPGSPFGWDEDEDYNLWRGFAVEPKRGDWSLLQRHIFENLCDRNKEYREYLLNWMAHLAQRPGELPGVAVCLHGGQGTGKGTFFQCLAALFPREHVMHVTKREHLVGRFNAHLSAKLLVFADEATFAGDKSIIGELNAIITERRRGVERKGIDVTEEENCAHLLMASNNTWFLHASRDARRYFVLDVSGAKAQNTAYFTAIMQQQRGGGTAAMLHDLLQRDISTFNPFHRPETEGLRRQRSWSLEGHEAWWKEMLTDMTPKEWEKASVRVKEELHESYLEWMKKMSRPHPLTPALFSKWLVTLYGPGILHRDRMSGRRRYVYRFPSLDACRRALDPDEAWPVPSVHVPRRRA